MKKKIVIGLLAAVSVLVVGCGPPAGTAQGDVDQLAKETQDTAKKAGKSNLPTLTPEQAAGDAVSMGGK